MKYLTTLEVARELRVSKQTLLNWLYSGKVPEPVRNKKGYRLWSPARVRLVRRLIDDGRIHKRTVVHSQAADGARAAAEFAKDVHRCLRDGRLDSAPASASGGNSWAICRNRSACACSASLSVSLPAACSRLISSRRSRKTASRGASSPWEPEGAGRFATSGQTMIAVAARVSSAKVTQSSIGGAERAAVPVNQRLSHMQTRPRGFRSEGNS